MSRLEDAAAKAHKAIDKLIADKASSPGPCNVCRFWAYNLERGHGYYQERCLNPVVAPPKFDPVSGDTIQDRVWCENQRSVAGLCGVEGRLFQPKEPPPPTPPRRSFWASLFRRR